MERYRTSYALDQGTDQEIGPFFWSQRRSRGYGFAAAVMGVLTLWMIMLQAYFRAVMFLLFAVRLVPTGRTRRWFCRRAACTRLYLGQAGRFESFFTEEGISVHNLTTASQSTIRYRFVRQAAETEHYFFIRLRGWWYTLVNKDCLTPEERKTFLPFLKEKCPQIKVMR